MDKWWRGLRLRVSPYFFWVVLLAVVLVSASPNSRFQQLQAHVEQRYGAGTQARVKQWIHLVQTVENWDRGEKLNAVNDFFNNNIIFTSDIQIWSQNDYWATPVEMMDKRQGDCEDYTIAKYITLRALGFTETQLRLIYVKAQTGPDPKLDVVAHMVLAFYPTPTADPLILDNLSRNIEQASRRRDLAPVFSFNAGSIWVAGQGQSSGNSQSRLSKWQEVLIRMREQGMDISAIEPQGK